MTNVQIIDSTLNRYSQNLPTQGAAGYIKTVSSDFADCRYEKCTSGERAGALFFTNSDGTLTECTFHTCIAKEGDGGAVEIDGTSNVAFVSCFFIACSSTGNGGVLSFEQVDCVVIRNSSFTSCSSGGHGGCCFVSLSPTQTQHDFEVDAKFTDCSCGEGKHGNWIHFTDFLFPPILDPSKWPVQKNALTLANTTLFTAEVEKEGVSSTIDLIDYIVFTLSTQIYVSNSETGSTSGLCGSTPATAYKTIDDALLQMKTSKNEIMVVAEGRLGEGVNVFGGYFGLCGETSMKTKLKVNAKRSGQTDGVIAGRSSAALAISNLRLTELASSDGMSGYLVFLSDSLLSIAACTMNASESLGIVHGTGRSFVEAWELVMKGTGFSSSVFLLVDESSVSLSDSTWTQLQTSAGSLVDVSGWLFWNMEISNMTISDCVCAEGSKPQLEIGLSGSSKREQRQILVKGSTFEGAAVASPFVHVRGNGIGSGLVLMSTEMRWTGWTSGSSTRTGMMIEWTERQPLVVRRGLKMENCALVVKKL
ncbi:hypothetical protein BLNAU_13291 [Blattamonas nauphoetae]|uniref:Right handed beta helix domain-containing protein n=1 Tax=Blattamonas nauphoetae TaxID=2049346 RepID=A0ABQ9XKC8_9EUKA|nr:hypothetical protein BLNAU_13291 [Blattamonas nauphoetae]